MTEASNSCGCVRVCPVVAPSSMSKSPEKADEVPDSVLLDRKLNGGGGRRAHLLRVWMTSLGMNVVR
jgi:hypothetical protein